MVDDVDLCHIINNIKNPKNKSNGQDFLLAFWLPLLSSPNLHSSHHHPLALSKNPKLSLSKTIMLLGKRQRPPMKRTTSMTEFTLDLNHTTTVDQHPNNIFNNSLRSTDVVSVDPRFSSVPVGPKIHRRNSGDFNQTSHFLKACHLCKRRLIAGRDIFMYRYI